MIDRRTLRHYPILLIASVLLGACVDNKDAGTPTVTVETIKPFVFDTFPRTDVNTVSTTEIIKITFSESIQPVDTNNITIAPLDLKTGKAGTAIVFPDTILVLSSQDKVLNVKLANANIKLIDGTQYLVVIKGITDYAGNVMLGSCEFVFSTTDAALTESLSGPCKTRPGTFGFSSANSTIIENIASGGVNVIVERINGSDGIVSVDYQTGVVVSSLISATAGVDYTITKGTLTFGNGVTQKSIFIPIVDDSDVEGDEIFNVSLLPTTIGTAIAKPGVGGVYPVNTITIIDNEIGTSNVIYFEAKSKNITENIAGSVVVFAVRRSIATNAMSVDFNTVDGTAKQGTDYQLNQGTLSFLPGEKVKDISIKIVDDKVAEARESFKVNLSNAIGARINSNYASIEIIITDDDQKTTPGNSVLSVSSSLKKLQFSWSPVNPRATYNLVENDTNPIFAKNTEIKTNLTGNEYVLDFSVHQNSWAKRNYFIQTCINTKCVDSNSVAVDLNLINGSIGYFKPSNTGQNDKFGTATALSDDGLTLVVGAPLEDSDLYGVVLATNIPSRNLDNNNATDSGAVYIYSRDIVSMAWQQTAYIKASNVQAGDHFGASVTLSGDGLTLAVGADFEDSAQVGTLLIPTLTTDNNRALDAGAVYVFTRASAVDSWVQQAYLKASNTGAGDHFGQSISLSKNGSLLAVGAPLEDSIIPNVVNDARLFPVGSNTETSTIDAGAVYVFSRTSTTNIWSQQAYLKSNKPDGIDFFGNAVDLSGDGSAIVIGAYGDDGNTNNVINAGALYKFTNDGTGIWSQQQYLPAIKPNESSGWSVSISDDGSTIAGSSIKTLATSPAGTAVAAGAVIVLYQGAAPNRGGYLNVYRANLDENFGESIALSGDGTTLAIGIPGNDSRALGVDNLARNAGAASIYKLTLTPTGGAWNFVQTIKASNVNKLDRFGSSVSLNFDGSSLAVGAINEQSQFTGVKSSNMLPDPAADNSVTNAGAVYLY